MVRLPLSGWWRKESRGPGEGGRLWKGMQWQDVQNEMGLWCCGVYGLFAQACEIVHDMDFLAFWII